MASLDGSPSDQGHPPIPPSMAWADFADTKSSGWYYPMPFPQDFGVEEKPQKIQCPPFLTPIVLRRQCSYELNVLVNPAAAEISELFKWVCLQGIPKSIDYSQLCHFPNELRTLSKWCYFAGKFGCELAVVSPVDLATSNGMLASLRNHLLGEIMLKPGLSYIYMISMYLNHCFKSAPRLTSWFGSVSKPCTPSVHIKIAGIYGCSFP